MIGRYGGCFEEDIMRLMCDRAYRIMGFRSPVRFLQTLEVRKGNGTILFPHLCFKLAPCSSYSESPILSLSYTSGNFHYRTWLVYSNDGLPQMP